MAEENKAEENTPTETPRNLTKRETEVLREIAAGKTNLEIGSTLKISVKTIEAHRARLFDKLGASNAPSAICRAYERRILTLPLDIYTTEELAEELRKRVPAPAIAAGNPTESADSGNIVPINATVSVPAARLHAPGLDQR